MENAEANRPRGDGSNIYQNLPDNNPLPLPGEDAAPQQYRDPAPLPQDDAQLLPQDDPAPQQHNGRKRRHQRAGRKHREAQHRKYLANMVSTLYEIACPTFDSHGGPRGRGGRGANNNARGRAIAALQAVLGLGRGAAAGAQSWARGATGNVRGRGRGIARGSQGQGRGYHAG